MQRTRKAGEVQPQEQPQEEPRTYTRRREPSEQKHIPGFVRNPPLECEFPKHNRDGIVCVDVITCSGGCMDSQCPAFKRHMVDAEMLKQSRK